MNHFQAPKPSYVRRTSGTEPKIKYYLEGCGKYEEKDIVDTILGDVVKELGGLWFEADKNNLGRP